MKITYLINNRQPDYILKLTDSNWLAFWWKEALQTNDLGGIHRFNIDTMEFEANGCWFKYAMYGRYIKDIKQAYLNWLLEKGLGL
jgi:hypothetical protein